MLCLWRSSSGGWQKYSSFALLFEDHNQSQAFLFAEVQREVHQKFSFNVILLSPFSAAWDMSECGRGACEDDYDNYDDI